MYFVVKQQVLSINFLLFSQKNTKKFYDFDSSNSLFSLWPIYRITIDLTFFFKFVSGKKIFRRGLNLSFGMKSLKLDKQCNCWLSFEKLYRKKNLIYDLRDSFSFFNFIGKFIQLNLFFNFLKKIKGKSNKKLQKGFKRFIKILCLNNKFFIKNLIKKFSKYKIYYLLEKNSLIKLDNRFLNSKFRIIFSIQKFLSFFDYKKTFLYFSNFIFFNKP